MAAKLDAMSPLKVLRRGYSMAFDERDHVVKSAHDVSKGQTLTVRLADGKVLTTVQEVEL